MVARREQRAPGRTPGLFALSCVTPTGGTGKIGSTALGGRSTVTIVPLPTLGRRDAAAAALAAKHRLQVSWTTIAKALDRSLVWSTSAVLGQQPLDAVQAGAVGSLLHLDDDVVAALQLPPVRGADNVDATEPVVYRLQEVVQVYGNTLAELIREEFGDGIMSAIDFELSFERAEDPKGDRVRLVLDGKFLPYRVY
ncbi:MAG: cyanate lyase [Pseudonocardiales bacterium]|jgi:cyanate lyase|nr:cyanate lyase [Pseudonocardiales bacterium]